MLSRLQNRRVTGPRQPEPEYPRSTYPSRRTVGNRALETGPTRPTDVGPWVVDLRSDPSTRPVPGTQTQVGRGTSDAGRTWGPGYDLCPEPGLAPFQRVKNLEYRVIFMYFIQLHVSVSEFSPTLSTTLPFLASGAPVHPTTGRGPGRLFVSVCPGSAGCSRVFGRCLALRLLPHMPLSLLFISVENPS